MQKIEAVKSVFDTTTSGRVGVTAVSADGVPLCNALELVKFSPLEMQVDICECGVIGCATGGWASFRRCGDDGVWIPAWDLMERSGDDYQPGGFYTGSGAPVFSAEVWQQLCKLHGAFPALSDLAVLDSRESVRLLQDSAPMHLLGKFPDPPVLRRDLLLGIVDGELESEADAIDLCLGRYFESITPVRLAADSTCEPMELLLDSFDEPTWTGVARYQGGVSLLLDGSRPLVLDAG